MSDFNSNIPLKSFWGLQNYVRIAGNILLWGFMLLFWALTLMNVAPFYSFLGTMMQGAKFVWFGRAFILIIW